MKKLISFFSLFTLFLILTGCEQIQNAPQKSLSGAEQITDMYRVPKNSKGHTVEQQLILDRVAVTMDPTKVMWIHLISLDGKIIKRMPVRNKVASSGKRLEPTVAASRNQYGDYYPNYGDYATSEFIQPDGTYGNSDPYIFWFDPMRRYHQWGTAGGLGYLLTDYPIDLQNPIDEITGLYNLHKAAYEWQKTEEAKLRKAEVGGELQH